MANNEKVLLKQPYIHRYVLPLAIFLIALLPRVLGSETFITYDEYDQLEFSARFLDAVSNQAWRDALVLGYPGVPTMGLGALGLWLYYQTSDTPLSSVMISPIRPGQTDVEPTQFVDPVNLYLLLNTIHADPLAYLQAVRLPLAIVASLTLVVSIHLVSHVYCYRLISTSRSFLLI